MYIIKHKIEIKTMKQKLKISCEAAHNLIAQQFSQWTHLHVKPVEHSGLDNITFRLGEDMLIRLPSNEDYAAKVAIEQKWLPILKQHLSFSIPEPLAQGEPSKDYPWNWSVYRWIEGESANTLQISETHLKQIALDLAKVLNELHKIDTTGAPLPGLHNFWRGAHPSVYDTETRSAIKELNGFIDANAAISLWEKATSSKWNKSPVWIHGDFASGNILIKNGRLVAVIDFGGMGVGDPACDLTIAWTFLKNESRQAFKSNFHLDSDTWTRARGWALWKALITLAQLKYKASLEAIKQKKIIDELIADIPHVNLKIFEYKEA